VTSGRVNRGFGLPELLAAIVIFGAGLVAVAGLISTAMHRTRADEWHTDQMLVARQALELAARQDFDSLVTGTDSTATGLGTYTVSRQVGITGPRLKNLTLIVSGLGSLPPLRLRAAFARPVTLP
jgi:prepilin-type N-terminal cleavage/methylation domain-containing protein